MNILIVALIAPPIVIAIMAFVADSLDRMRPE
jgi:hypothetical protein